MKSNTLIRFSWTPILEYYNYNCDKSIIMLSKIITNRYSIKESNLVRFLKKQVKDCWLCDPVGFLTSGATVNEKCIYLHVATKRNWMDYELYGVGTVPIFIVKELYNTEKIKSNPLIEYDIVSENFILKY